MSGCECTYVHMHVFQAECSAGEKVLSKEKTCTRLRALADQTEDRGWDVR